MSPGVGFPSGFCLHFWILLMWSFSSLFIAIMSSNISSPSFCPFSFPNSYFLNITNSTSILCISWFSFFFFLGLHPRHMEIPKQRVEWELQLSAYTTATATRDLSCICDLHHSSQHARSLTLNGARVWTHAPMDASQVRYHCATGNSLVFFYIYFLFSPAALQGVSSVCFPAPIIWFL